MDFHSQSINFKLSKKLRVAKWISNTIQIEKKTEGDISFIFCSDPYLKNLNKKYLNHNYLTDILTFPYTDAGDNIINGDIFISIERVKENAKIFKITFIEELHRVMIHGILHLCGHKDKTIHQQKKMRTLENKYLENFIH